MGLSHLVLGDLRHPSTFPDQGWSACSLQQCWGRRGLKAERTGSQRWGRGGRYALASLNGLRPLGSRDVVLSSLGNQGCDCDGMKGAGGDSLPGLRLHLAYGPGHSSHVWLGWSRNSSCRCGRSRALCGLWLEDGVRRSLPGPGDGMARLVWDWS